MRDYRAGSSLASSLATQSISLFKAHRAAGSHKLERAKALATNALDAVGQRQNALDAVGAATQTHEQKGSLGE